MRRMLTENEVKEIASQGTYVAGDGINIDDNEISVDSEIIPTIEQMNTAIANAIGNVIGGSY